MSKMFAGNPAPELMISMFPQYAAAVHPVTEADAMENVLPLTVTLRVPERQLSQ